MKRLLRGPHEKPRGGSTAFFRLRGLVTLGLRSRIGLTPRSAAAASPPPLDANVHTAGPAHEVPDFLRLLDAGVAGIEAAGPKSLEIHGYVSISQSLEPFDQLLSHPGLEQPRKLRRRHLDPGQLPVMAHPQLRKAQRTQQLLGTLHHLELLPR